jgi:putative phosphoesterase
VNQIYSSAGTWAIADIAQIARAIYRGKMRIGVLSDTHGRIEAVLTALAEFRERGVELIVHCGDIDTPQCAERFIGWDAHFVFGNCDWDRDGIRESIGRISATLHEPFGHLELDGTSIAWIHGDQPHLFRDLEASNAFDYLFFGHTHVAEQRGLGKTLVVNPGALHRARTKTCLVLDTQFRELTTVTI